MIAFEAATPFQIYNCINILNQYYPKEDADIFLYLYASELTSIGKRLGDAGIFKNIYYINRNPKTRMETICFLANPSKMIQVDLVNAYNELFVSYTGIENIILYNFLLQSNPYMRINFFEDGVTSYYNGFFRCNWKIGLILKILGLKKDSKNIRDIYLYEPRLNRVNYNNKKIIIHKLNPCTDARIKEDTIEVFSITERAIKLLRNSKYIYLDHDFRKYISKDVYINFSQNDIVNRISDIVGRVVVKISPLADENESRYFGTEILVSNFERAPWEMLIGQDDELEQRCIITVCSNASVTPKTVFGKEPFVVILGKALFNSGLTNSKDVWDPKMEEYYLSISELYTEKSKFYVPETLDEAFILLRSFAEKGDIQ